MVNKCSSLLFVTLFAGIAHAGVISCPDQTYLAVPITGVTGGEASSCGNASVDLLGGVAATPGKGTVDSSTLGTYLGVDLSTLAPSGFGVTEGSGVVFAGFIAPANSKLTFSWNSDFEEGGTGSVFYILNGTLTELHAILPEGQGLPGESDSDTATVNLLAGANTFAFGAVSLANTSRGFSQEVLDPQLTITNLEVTPLNGVPEPGTFLLLGAGLAGLAVWTRRR